MVSGLKQVNPLVSHQIHQPIFGCNPPRPQVGTEVLQGLRLPDAVND
ncbi:MAG: hypothetical protein Q7S20_07145 [Gemmatimonadaceae bacterium]|nr:hypothetical protein [Gemmatimonadaceae bacterium]